MEYEKDSVTDPPREGNGESARKTNFFESENVVGQLHGEASSFSGKPFFSFGDMWDVVAPNITDELPRYLELAKMAYEFRTTDSHAQACYLDFPDGNSPVIARMVVTRKAENATLVVAYPVFAGYPATAELSARFDWDNGVCGFISTLIGEGHWISLFLAMAIREIGSFPERRSTFPSPDSCCRWAGQNRLLSQ